MAKNIVHIRCTYVRTLHTVQVVQEYVGSMHLDFRISAEETRIVVDQTCQLCSIKKIYQMKEFLENKLG